MFRTAQGLFEKKQIFFNSQFCKKIFFNLNSLALAACQMSQLKVENTNCMCSRLVFTTPLVPKSQICK